MTIAFRSHLDSHEMASQHIGAGLIRNTCLVCDHLSLSDDAESIAVGAAVIPAWMQQAADRFEVVVEPQLAYTLG